MLRGGVIMDVVDAEQAKIAEDAGAVAVMALERVPSDIRRDGGVARMSDPSMIEGIQKAVTDPGHGQVPHRPLRRGAGAAGARRRLRRRVGGADARPTRRTTSTSGQFTVPFVCGATNLGEALRRISEGACLIRSKGEAGTGNIVEAVRHLRSILGDIERIKAGRPEERYALGQGAARAGRPRRGGRRARRAARAVVLRGRHRHTGRRRARHAARRAVGVRRQRHLQVE